MAVFSDLPTDILDRVLMHLRDFNTLSAAIKICKSVYDVFEAHPKSIVQAVAYNIAGPALPDAVRLIPFAQYANPADNDGSEPPHDSEPGSVLPFSRRDTAILSENAHVVSRLEALYSMSKKDRTAAASTLTDAESARFTRAMYRLWEVLSMLLCKLSEEEDERMRKAENDHDMAVDDDDDDDGDAEWPDFLRTQVIAFRKIDVQDYLNKLENRELFAVDAVADFLQDVAIWTKTATDESWGPRPLQLPSTALGQFVTERFRHEHDGPLDVLGWETLDDLLSAVYRKRDVDDAKRRTERPKAVLDTVVGQHDLCHRCYNSAQLWGRSNFTLLRGALTKREVCTRLKGRLFSNELERRALHAHLATRNDSGEATFDWGRMFAELCTLPADADTGDVWDAEKYYCMHCVEALLDARLTAWWLARKREMGVDIGEDCWYGYSCRTQTHKREHAQRLNHLCAPTRGDGYVPRAAAAAAAADGIA